jgi:hypothetical protein
MNYEIVSYVRDLAWIRRLLHSSSAKQFRLLFVKTFAVNDPQYFLFVQSIVTFYYTDNVFWRKRELRGAKFWQRCKQPANG